MIPCHDSDGQLMGGEISGGSSQGHTLPSCIPLARKVPPSKVQKGTFSGNISKSCATFPSLSAK